MLNNKRLVKTLLVILMAMLTACGKTDNRDADITKGSDMKEQSITITSTDLNDGVWNEAITNTAFGENKSPQLSWDKVENAGCYAIIMIDPDGNNWLHWIETDVKENEIPTGYSSTDSYIGPYPPGGTHHYTVYVYALKEPRVVTSARFNQSSNNISTIQNELSEGGNCLGYGMIEGTYTAR